MGCFTSKPAVNDSYEPSSFAMMLVPKKSLYKAPKEPLPKLTTLGYKILVVATCDGRLTMLNGKVFNSGVLPSELLVFLLHMKTAGFAFEFANVSGKPVVLEEWGMPGKDDKCKAMRAEVQSLMDAPKKLSDVSNKDYAGIYIPGGHGQLVNLTTSQDFGKLLHDAQKQGQPVMALCHGPAALIASNAGDSEFAYKGYKMACFSAATDTGVAPTVGYLPGKPPIVTETVLRDLGADVKGSEKGAVVVDRELITGDSPAAENKFAIAAVPIVVTYAEKANNQA